jgi:SPP1 family phage portal protein
MRATLYELDGYTEFIWRDGVGEILKPKRAYTQIVAQSVADGVEIRDGENYPAFPIVPLWANREHQSEFAGLREKIDGYDLIQSGLANDLDTAQIYWIINNAGGMDEIDLAKFINQIKRVGAAVIEEDGAHAESHTINIPYQARQVGLAELKDSLYRDAMAVDDEKITSGNITATAINAAYKNLNLKCDGYEYCVSDCIRKILKLLNIDDKPTFYRSQDTNQAEMTQVVLSAADHLDEETILTLLPFISIDRVKTILKRKEEEDISRYSDETDEKDVSSIGFV